MESWLDRPAGSAVVRPPQAAAVDEGPLSILTNPAGLGLRSGGAAWLHEEGAGPFGRQADALLLSLGGLRAGDRSALALGLSAEWVRLAQGCTAGNAAAPCWWRGSLGLSWATPSLALGAAWRWVDSGESAALDGAGVLAAGLTWRPASWVSLAATGEALNAPSAVAPRGTLSLALRPLGNALTLAADYGWSGSASGGPTPTPQLSWLAGWQWNGWGVAAELAHPAGASTGPGLSFLMSLRASLDRLSVEGGGGAVRDGAGGLQGGGLSAVEVAWDRGPSVLSPVTTAQRLPLDSALAGPSRVARLLGLNGEPEADLRLALRLEALAHDDTLDTLVIELHSTADLSWGRVEELRERLLALRKAGRRVVVWLGGADDEAYYLATAADRIVAAPQAMLELDGLALQRFYLRGLLDKLGVLPQFVRAGGYKSAPEMFTEAGPTAPASEAGEALLEDTFGRYVAAVAEARKLPLEKVRELIEQGGLLSEQAVEAGLVDAVSPGGAALQKQVKEVAGRLLPMREEGPARLRPVAWGASPRVELLVVRGTIGGDGDDDVDTEALVEQLHEAAEDPLVRAVVLRIESPGGSVADSELLWQAVREVQELKPVVASLGDVAASGGYYVACAAGTIVAEPSTLTGSIGVFAGKADLSALMQRLGVGVHVMRRGSRADAMSLFRPWTEAERAAMETLVGRFYETFLQRVAKGRNMNPTDVHAVAQGRVWTGAQARERRLVDRLGGLIEAISLAREQAGLPPRSPASILAATGPTASRDQRFSAGLLQPTPMQRLPKALLEAGQRWEWMAAGAPAAAMTDAARPLLEALTHGRPMALAWDLPTVR